MRTNINSLLISSDLWGLCRVIETITCLNIGSEYFYCSPLGLFRDNQGLLQRVFKGSVFSSLARYKNESVIVLFRDPREILNILLRDKDIFRRNDLEELISRSGLATRAFYNLLESRDEFDVYVVHPVNDLKRCCEDPRNIPRICRSEMSLVELMILYTRLDLLLRETGASRERIINYARELIRIFNRLSIGSGETDLLIERIARSLF